MKKVEMLANEIKKEIEYCETLYSTAETVKRINSIVQKHAPVIKPFPKVMISTDYEELVYMIKPMEGYMIKASQDDSVRDGEYYKRFNMKWFKDCEIQVKP
jgi:hypothetical protein